jgi:mannose-6-phosphate isomerase-like protein (cupin superfamily)
MALASIEAAPTPANLSWRPVRAALGIRAFGVGGYAAAEVGDALIEPHTESEDGRGHEELYFVVRGAATFTLDGERFDAPAGTCVFVGDPSVRRHAVASAQNTEVLAFGGEPVFEPAGDEWMWRVRALLTEQLERAREVADGGLIEAPGNPGVYYAEALIAAADGRAENAREWLAKAVEVEPRLIEEARREQLLAAVAGALDSDGA